MLSVKHLTIKPLFHGVTFSVSPGEIVTLMGPSGSGKSTLFSWMIGALSADFTAQGELWLGEQRCDRLPVEQRGLGILFQDALLFDSFSVGQNLLLALPARITGYARNAAVQDALASAGLGGHYHSDPATLSGGERARVSLLRALLAEPQACCWTSRSVGWIKRCVRRFAPGCLRPFARGIFRSCWSHTMKKIFRPAER